MVAAVVSSLDHRRAAELTAPDNQAIVEHPALFQVDQQGGAGLVVVVAVPFQVVDQVAVLVPGFMEDLDKPYPALGQSTGRQAGIGNDDLSGSTP